jgi:hypothetical protein
MPLVPVDNLPAYRATPMPNTRSRVSKSLRENAFPPSYTRSDKENEPSCPSEGWLNNLSWIGM